MNWIIASFGFFAGFMLNDILWRFANTLRSTLVETQQEMLAEQDKLIETLRRGEA